MPARSGKEPAQGVQRGEHLPAPAEKEPVQGVRRGEHLPASADKEQVQGVRRGELLPARAEKEPMQGVRRGEHLRAPAEKVPMQGVQTIEGQWGRSVRHHEQGTGAINMLSTPLKKKTTETCLDNPTAHTRPTYSPVSASDHDRALNV